MSLKATECSELSGVMLKPVFLNSLLATAALFDIYRITLPGLTKKLYINNL